MVTNLDKFSPQWWARCSGSDVPSVWQITQRGCKERVCCLSPSLITTADETGGKTSFSALPCICQRLFWAQLPPSWQGRLWMWNFHLGRMFGFGVWWISSFPWNWLESLAFHGKIWEFCADTLYPWPLAPAFSSAHLLLAISADKMD